MTVQGEFARSLGYLWAWLGAAWLGKAWPGMAGLPQGAAWQGLARQGTARRGRAPSGRGWARLGLAGRGKAGLAGRRMRFGASSALLPSEPDGRKAPSKGKPDSAYYLRRGPANAIEDCCDQREQSSAELNLFSFGSDTFNGNLVQNGQSAIGYHVDSRSGELMCMT